jgi:predicted transcriptional regulator
MHSFLFNIYLSITQETILCYLCVYGISENTYKIILDEGIVSVDQILYNHISKLIKKGFVIKKGRNKYVLEDLKIKSITENSAYIMIKLHSKEKLEIKKHE